MAKGDLVRITHWINNDLDEPAWAVISDEDVETPDITFLANPPEGWEKPWDYSILSACDVYEIVPENDVPDEVWVALAKRALLEDAQ